MAENSTLRDVVVASMLGNGQGGPRTPLGTASILSSENIPIQGLGTNPYVMGHRVGATGRNQNIASQNAQMQLMLNELMAESAAASSAAKAQMEANQFAIEQVQKAGGLPSDMARLTGLPGDYSAADEVRRLDAQPSSIGLDSGVGLSGMLFDDNGRPIKYKHEVTRDEFETGQARRQADQDNALVTRIQKANPGITAEVQGDQVILTNRSTGASQVYPRSQMENIGK